MQRLRLAEGSDAMIAEAPAQALAERLRLRRAIMGAMAEGQSIVGLDRERRE